MAAPFDPDAYLAKKVPAPRAPSAEVPAEPAAFDPDAYLQQRAPAPAKPFGAEALATGKAFGRGVGQGLTFNFGDEMGAAEQALLAKVARKWPGLGDALGIDTRYLAEDEDMQPGRVYETARLENREQLARDEREHGKAAFAGNLAGGLVLAPLSPGGAAANAGRAAQYGRAALTGAGFGALGGVGASQADLTEGEYGKAALHGLGGAVLGAGLGIAGKAAGDGLSAGLRALGSRATRGISEAVEQQAARELALAEKAIASAKGSYGKSVSEAARDLEVMAREADELPAGAARDALAAYLASPEALALREAVAGAKLETAPTRIADMVAKKAGLESLTAGKEANVAAQTGEALASPWAKHIRPRVMTLGSRLLPPAIAGVGGILGGPEGAAAGAVVGGVMSLTQGAPGRIVKNLMESPAVRKAAWERVGGVASEGVQKATENVARPLLWKTAHALATRPEVFGPFAAGLAKAIQGGEDALAAEHARLSATSPDYQERMRRLAAEDEWN